MRWYRSTTGAAPRCLPRLARILGRIVAGHRIPARGSDIGQPRSEGRGPRHTPAFRLDDSCADQERMAWIHMVELTTSQLISGDVHLVCDARKEVSEEL